jgi:DNA polymerase-4
VASLAPAGFVGRGSDGSDAGHRVILHVDMDSFFASVEVLDNPALRGLPVIVGGSGARGVVAACTYEARMFGVHSAMPSAVARRLCPQALFVDGRYHRYVEESKKLHAIFESVTPLIEGISIDEAFLDVTGSQQLLGDGRTIAEGIRRRVRQELNLTCSVGVGRSKLIAKLASKAAKPVATREGITPGPGVVEVRPEDEIGFLHPLPVRALWGVGPVTGRKLDALGIVTVGDIAQLPDGALERYLGRAQGAHLANLSRGEDPRPVEPEQVTKSIGHEETFATDLWDRADLESRLSRMVDASGTLLRQSGLAARTVNLKVRFGDFRTITRSHSMSSPIDATHAIAAVATALLDSVERNQGVRLLGVSLSGLGQPGGDQQLMLDFGAGSDQAAESAEDRLMQADLAAERIQQSWGSVTDAVDAIRARYGGSSVGPASLVGPQGLTVRRRGEAQWGPTLLESPEADDD